jgi:cellulose synthase (UDP-forming)
MMTDPVALESRSSSSPVQLAAAALMFVVVAWSARFPLAEENQMMLSGGILVVLFLLGWTERRLGEFNRVAVIVLGAYLSLRYWMFRTTETLSFTDVWDFIFLMLLYLAETYGIFTHLVGLFVNVAPCGARALHCPPTPFCGERGCADPHYNEPVDMVALTLTACTQLNYPKDKLNVFVLDGGGTTQSTGGRPGSGGSRPAAGTGAQGGLRLPRRALSHAGTQRPRQGRQHQRRAGRGHRHRSAEPVRPRHNLGLGEPRPRGDLVLVFDCDHVPTKDFLQNTVGFFIADDKLACVRPLIFSSTRPRLKKPRHFHGEPGRERNVLRRDSTGAGLLERVVLLWIGGSSRRRHLMEIGGLVETPSPKTRAPLSSCTPGAEQRLSEQGHDHGPFARILRQLYHPAQPMGQGMIQILLLRSPLWTRGLSLAQRACYLNACLFWLFGFARMIFFLSPLMFLVFGLRVYNASLMQVLIYAVPHLLASYFVSNHLYGKLRHPFYSELFEIIQSIYLIPAIVSVFLNPWSPRFRVTPKSISLKRDTLTHLATLFYLMLLLNLLAFCAGAVLWLNRPTLLDTIAICLCWNTFNMFLMVCCLGVVWERRQLRQSHRYATREPVTLRVPESGEQWPAWLRDLSSTGIRLRVDHRVHLPSSRLLLQASDSYGNRYELPLHVIRAVDERGRKILGCRFIIEDESARRQVVGFVYGDSGRWKYFTEGRRGKAIGTLRAFFKLVGIGLKGSWRHAAGLTRLTMGRRSAEKKPY